MPHTLDIASRTPLFNHPFSHFCYVFDFRVNELELVESVQFGEVIQDVCGVVTQETDGVNGVAIRLETQLL